jgi:LacI family transcriptional regulator
MVHTGVIEPALITAALRGDLPAIALITGNAQTTIEVLRQLGSAAGDVAIVGFDDFLLADLLRPGMTVVAQDSATIGRTAIELLLARAAGSGELPPR